MPLISVTLLPGYPGDVEERLAARLATAARSVVAASSAGTTVAIQHASTYYRDGHVFTGGAPARPVASEIVREFLQRMQQRDLAGAGALLAPDFTMCFPGGALMHRLEELLEWASGRYRSVAKDYERFEECWSGEGAVVYCSGTLHGVWTDGREFSGIRFIDRLEVVDGRIRRQDVWNDLAEATARAATA